MIIAQAGKLYQWAFHILEKEWNYTINRTDDQTKKTTIKGKRYIGKEVFILNYDVIKPLSLQIPLDEVGFDLVSAT